MFRMLFVFFLLSFLPGKGQNYKPITDYRQIKAQVDSNRFEMEYTIATTHYTFYLQPSTPYTDQNIRIAKDSAFIIIRDSLAAGYLPYFGSGYSIPQTGKRGIVFSNKMIAYSMKTRGKGARQTITYVFAVVGLNDTYKMTVDIQHDGSCYLYVNSLRRSPISYVGQIVEKIH